MSEEIQNTKLPYLPASRKALASARTLDQLLTAIDELKAFRNVWVFLGDKLREAVPSSGSSEPGPFRPEYGMSVLNDLEEVVRRIDKDLEAVRATPLGSEVKSEIFVGLEVPDGDEFPGEAEVPKEGAKEGASDGGRKGKGSKKRPS